MGKNLLLLCLVLLLLANENASRVRFKFGATISNAPTGRVRKVNYRGVAAPRREKHLMKRHLHDRCLTFTPTLKRTPLHIEMGTQQNSRTAT